MLLCVLRFVAGEQVSVWKRVLERKEVLAMSRAGTLKGTEKGLVVLWDFSTASEESGGVPDKSDHEAEVGDTLTGFPCS